MDEWYEETQENNKIYQGEILLELPTYTPILPKKTGDVFQLSESVVDYIVISQACDLENKKIERVMLAQIIDIKVFISSLIEQNNDNTKNYKNKLKDATKNIFDMNKGAQPRYHILKSKNTNSIRFGFKVIDFSSVNTVLFDDILGFKQKKVTIALKTPYREYVGQRFGNFYSRIGLPIGIKDRDIKEFIESNIKE